MSYEQAVQAIERARLAGVTRLALVPRWKGNVRNWFDASQYSKVELIRLDEPLTNVPPEIGQLTNLVELYLSNNKLSHFPPEIGQLTNLTKLNLAGNQLRELPPEIRHLINLTELNLAENQFRELPPEIGQLTNLTKLNLAGNQLRELPPEIGQLINLTELNLYDNYHLFSLFSIIHIGGIKAIMAYFKQLKSEGMDILCEAKLLIVGEPGAGKTTLARKLLNPQAELPGKEESTRGIDIQPWLFPTGTNRNRTGKPSKFAPFAPNSATLALKETFQANMWDFGGQEIYHATHRFFLTKRALYVLVADTRAENTDFYYWLNMIELLGGDSPIVIVKNEMDDRPRPINEGQLRERFVNLQAVLSTNLADGRGLSQLLDTIQFQLTHLPHVGDRLPQSWVKVRQALEQEARQTLDWREFLAVCEAHGFRELAHKLNLSTYLHELGICLHYQDDPLLKRTVFLKPDWCTAAVYKVLDTRQIVLNQGHFKRAELETIWHEAEYEFLRDELLQLMLKFQLCYKIPGSEGDYIAPQLLAPEPPPYEWTDSPNLHLRYRYPRFMPKGIVTTFTVMLHRYIWQQSYVWRGGLILAKDETLAEIKEDYEGRQITIRLHGANPRDLLRTIIDALDEIHDSYHNLLYEKLIPCNCGECAARVTPHFYEYEDLRRRQSKGKLTVECNISYDDVNVTRLLDSTLGSAEEQRRRGLDASLKKRLTTVLIDCHQFADEREFRALFVDSRIIAWRDKLPQADNIEGRVQLLLSELQNQYDIKGNNALALFLAVLQAQFDPMNALHDQLSRLADEVRLVKGR